MKVHETIATDFVRADASAAAPVQGTKDDASWAGSPDSYLRVHTGRVLEPERGTVYSPPEGSSPVSDLGEVGRTTVYLADPSIGWQPLPAYAATHYIPLGHHPVHPGQQPYLTFYHVRYDGSTPPAPPPHEGRWRGRGSPHGGSPRGGSPHGGSPHGGSPRGGSPERSDDGPKRASARIARSVRLGARCDPGDLAIDPVRAPSDPRTTIMLRNLPNRYRRPALLARLGERGLGGLFDVLYLPIDYRSGFNLGYAFINMMSPDGVAKAQRALAGLRWEPAPCGKIAALTYARLQGRSALVAHLRDAHFPSDDPDLQPVVFTGLDPNGGAIDPVPLTAYLLREQSAGRSEEPVTASTAGVSPENATPRADGDGSPPPPPTPPSQSSCLPAADSRAVPRGAGPILPRHSLPIPLGRLSPASSASPTSRQSNYGRLDGRWMGRGGSGRWVPHQGSSPPSRSSSGSWRRETPLDSTPSRAPALVRTPVLPTHSPSARPAPPAPPMTVDLLHRSKAASAPASPSKGEASSSTSPLVTQDMAASDSPRASRSL